MLQLRARFLDIQKLVLLPPQLILLLLEKPDLLFLKLCLLTQDLVLSLSLLRRNGRLGRLLRL